MICLYSYKDVSTTADRALLQQHLDGIVHWFMWWHLQLKCCKCEVLNVSNKWSSLLYVTVLAKTRIVCTKIEFNFIAIVDRHTQYLSIPSASCVKCWLVCFCEGYFSNTPKLRLEQWHPWRVPFGQWGPGFTTTDYVAHHCVIGPVCVHHGCSWVSQTVVFASPPHPTTYLTHPCFINTDSKKGRQKITWNSARDREG